MKNKLEICKQTRKLASDSLAKVLKKLLKKSSPISEVLLRDDWLKELRKNSSVFSDGWYVPPPHGMSVLFATENDTKRVSPPSLRPKKYWPSQKIHLNRIKGLVMVYASVVHKKTGIIGDFGLTLYFGKNKKIQEHLKKSLEINYAIFDYIYEGIKFLEINDYTHKLLAANGLKSNLSSPSDPTGTNIGHTIPFTYEKTKPREEKILHATNKEWSIISTLISKKRVFLNSIENFKVRKGCAFTIEPRPHMPYHPEIPRVWFHTVAFFKDNGKKELLTDFQNVFKAAGMDYMLNTDL